MEDIKKGGKMKSYKVCFVHRRIFNPALLQWEAAVHSMAAYVGHLNATLCDICQKEKERGQINQQMAKSYVKPAS